MSSLLKIPKKDLLKLCYILVISSILLLIYLSILSYKIKESWHIVFPISANVVIILIISWFIRGGKIAGIMEGKKFGIFADSSTIRREGEDFPKEERE